MLCFLLTSANFDKKFCVHVETHVLCFFLSSSLRLAESLHEPADLTEAAEFEGFRGPAKNASRKKSAPKREPFLRHRLRRHIEFWQSFVTSSFVMGILLTSYMLP
jgi:hypothetical protein